jgi:hypothetical protein
MKPEVSFYQFCFLSSLFFFDFAASAPLHQQYHHSLPPSLHVIFHEVSASDMKAL